MSTQPQAPQSRESRSVRQHNLPDWFITFQDTAGLSLLIIALMGINGVVYASGVVPNIESPQDWGMFHGLLFVLFFLAGAAMPGVALRAGAGIFIGEWYRRLACLVVSLLFFALEVWCSVTERSLTTITSPADRWLLALIGLPNLPFSPTALVISLAISLIVIVWGLVTGVTAEESTEDRARRQQAELEEARHKAEVRTVRVGGLRAAAVAAFGKAPTDEPIAADNAPDTAADADGDGGDGGGIAADNPRTRSGAAKREPTLRLTPFPRRPRGVMTASELAAFLLDRYGRTVTYEAALNLVKTVPGATQLDAEKGQPWAAPKTLLIQRARQLWAEVPADKAREA